MPMRAALAVLLACLVAACARPAPDTVAAVEATPVEDARPVAAGMQVQRSPDLSHVVLDDPRSDSPFRWLPVAPGPPRTRMEQGVMWAPVAPVVHVLRPGATIVAEGEVLRVDGEPLPVPVMQREGEAWAAVAPLALALGGYAHPHPGDGSMALWPAPMLQWLAEHGDPRAPVLAGARAAGALPAADAAPAGDARSRLRIRNEGPAGVQALVVQFPDAQVSFGDVAAGATSGYRTVEGGVFNYAAYRARLGGKDVAVPVIDWVGESPLPAGDYTYVITVDPQAALPVALVRSVRDR